MALPDLLRAIEADADADRARASRDAAAEAAAIVEHARREADALEAELAAAPEAAAVAEAERTRALARLHASEALRSAREEAFSAVMTGIRAELRSLREQASYPELLRALLAESRALLPEARELRVDPLDVGAARALADDLRVEASLRTCGGLELAGADGRTIRNTVEERLANAEPLLRLRYAQHLAAPHRMSDSR
jgi:vacuolar-type H+-ATPase subunit E/Vma4